MTVKLATAAVETGPRGPWVADNFLRACIQYLKQLVPLLQNNKRRQAPQVLLLLLYLLDRLDRANLSCMVDCAVWKEVWHVICSIMAFCHLTRSSQGSGCKALQLDMPNTYLNTTD